jgi:uncharacterized protein YcfL
MKPRVVLVVVVMTFLLLSGCSNQKQVPKSYAEVPSMLNILTNKAQVVVENGGSGQNEVAVLKAVREMNPKVASWFDDQALELKIGAVAETAVVMVCDQGRPVYEDTYCQPGAPDRDHRNSGLETCEITITEQDLMDICQ